MGVVWGRREALLGEEGRGEFEDCCARLYTLPAPDDRQLRIRPLRESKRLHGQVVSGMYQYTIGSRFDSSEDPKI
jgi:hypothetical protein